MRCFIVCVDFADILAITLPYNQRHFDEIIVITSKDDNDTHRVVCHLPHRLIDKPLHVFSTSAFYDDGADFNKWKALEQALDAYGRHGWICLLDVDILWPGTVRIWNGGDGGLGINPANGTAPLYLKAGQLCTPLRRMWLTFPHSQLPVRYNDHLLPEFISTNQVRVPHEVYWTALPLHRNMTEWAGYTQIFHGSDPVLGVPPWHQVDWRHAGGADSFFQEKWSRANKIRPPFEVLHLGPTGVNWCGRAQKRVDGSIINGAQEKVNRTVNYIRSRVPGPHRFDHERLKPKD